MGEMYFSRSMSRKIYINRNIITMGKFVRVLILGIFSLVGSCMQTIQSQNPNIIVILADNMGYGDV